MGLFDSISWFQSELVYYDAWLWDTSIEQRIIRELGTKSEKIIGCKNNRVDLDILNGSAYKNKSKNDWTAEVWRGIKTTAFASIHGDYWLRHTSPRVAVYILFHFSLQLLQVICYLLLDPRTTKVTTSDILVPMALGVGLGILHAQITAYDPQRLKRNRHSPPASVDSTADVEPPQSPTPLPTSSLPLPSEVNFSNFVDSIPQPKPVSTWKPDKEVIFSESNHVTEEISDQTNSQQSIEVKETESGDKLLQDFKEVKNESEASESSNPMPYRRRALSFKIVPSQHETVTSNLDGNSAQDEFPSSSVNSPDEGLGVLEVKIPTYFRKRSASLSPDFCLNLPDPPLEMKILQFKEAKMRGVTDPEVLADIQHQQVQQQQLSPILMNVPEWEGDVEEGDEESGDENVEIAGSGLPQNEADSNSNGNVSKRSILSLKKEERPKVINGEHDSIEPLELDHIKEENESMDHQDEDEEEGNDEQTEGEVLEGGPEEADVDDNDFDEDDVELNDTFMANRRQRANFYKIFVQRATYHRYHNQRSKNGEEAQILIKSNFTPESLSVLHSSKNSSNSNMSIVPPGRRGSNAAQKRTSLSSGRTKNVNFMKKNSPVESAGHPTSETEYERMNSDVRSDETTSGSDDEQSALREHASHSHLTNTSTTESSALASGTASSKQVKYQSGQQLKKLSVRTVGLTEDDSPSRTPSPVRGVHSTTSSVEEKAGWTGNAEVQGSDAPFALWYFHTIQGMSDPSYSQLESVSCYVWEGKHMRKISFTLLDIGWRIIQAVERQKVSNIYPKAAVVIVFLLTILPLFFHTFNQSAPNRPPNASVRIGPLPEFEMLATVTNPFKTPGTLVLYLYHKIANFVTHFWFQTRQGVWDDVLRVATLDNLVIALGIFLRFNIYAVIFFLLCVAERAFQQRYFYAKNFFALTSSHRARKCCIPHLRLNKVAHIKCWLTLRSYLKKRGPQRSVECIVTATFYLAFGFGLLFCYQFLWYGSSQRQGVFSSPLSWDILAYTAGLSVFLLRFLTLGLKITKKFRNVSVLLSEQLNLHLCMNRKPQKKDELTITNQVLRMAESLLKEVDGPYRICGWAVNPLIYNIFKLVLLSCFSAFISEILGFKLKLYKLKLNPANW